MWGIELKRHSEIPLARQIYMTLREQMLAGFLQAGEMLPSTREMATDLSVSRNTVCEAYEMLAAEGYIISHQGSPTRVADGLQLKRPVPAFQKLNESFQAIGQPTADFWTGQPDLRRFPMRLWLQLVRISAAELPITQWGYTGPDGLPALREQIATWLFRSKGLEVSPQDIFITAGSTHALHIIAEILSSEGKEIIVEDPCHMGMIQVLQKTGFIIRPVPVDGHGIQTEHIESQGACAVYLTPSHQFPLGGILPAGRRADLIRMARNNNLYLIEDDYDSEFRYAGPPITPLFSMDPQRVIYVGTFSKILFPALRIGYVVLPRQLHTRWRHLRTHTDVQNPPFEQAALAEFLRTRKLDRHVQQMRRLYGRRRQLLLQMLEATFGQTWRPWGDAAGLHMAVEFPGKRFDQNFLHCCKEHGLRINTVEYHSIRKGFHLEKILLGYGHLEAEEIQKGLKLLHNVVIQIS